jgi:hypothetical protein
MAEDFLTQTWLIGGLGIARPFHRHIGEMLSRELMKAVRHLAIGLQELAPKNVVR